MRGCSFAERNEKEFCKLSVVLLADSGMGRWVNYHLNP